MLKNGGARFCLIWFAVAFIAFSAISGKQPHYLLPEFPAVALLAAYALLRPSDRPLHRFALLPVAILFAVIGIALLAIPLLPLKADWTDEVVLVQSWWGALPLAMAALFAFIPPATIKGRMAALSLSAGVLVIAAHLALMPLLQARHNVTAAARYLHTLEQNGYALGFHGNYHGQFQFAGRLDGKVHELGQKQGDVEVFLATFERSKFVTYDRTSSEIIGAEAIFPYRSGRLAVWDRAVLAADPLQSTLQ